ncbi:MAG: tetratricopeptide repeat protein [Thermoanaerobaculia bacterium]
MKRTRDFFLILVAVAVSAGVAQASWYDDYDAGLDAVRKGQWQVVVQKMTAAINGHGTENDKTRTYSTIFINYHPYYYRGVAYLNLGKYEQAVNDLEKTSGPGEENLGSVETLMQRVKSKMSASSPEPQPAPPIPAPQPRPTPVPLPAPVQPAGPSIDPGLKQQVASAITGANASLANARNRRASSSPQYQQAMQALVEANQRSGNARSNEDLNAALALARNAVLFADSATAPNMPAPPVAPVPTRPAAASAVVLADTARRLRPALDSYFRGDFDESERAFQRISEDMPRNGWVYAFLGASQYSRWAFEADERFRTAAMESFRKARQFGRFKDGLPEKYFSRRIRAAFQTAVK